MGHSVKIIAVLAACLLFLLRRVASRRQQLPNPPGPKGLPLLGNLFDFPTTDPVSAALKWHRQYGNITSLHMLGKSIVYLHSAQTAKDLLMKRGAIYSDRPQLIMATDLYAILGPDDDRLRKQRALMERVIGAASIPAHCQLLEIETIGLLHRLVQAPEDYRAHFVRYSTALTCLVVYGHRVTSNEDWLVKMLKGSLDLLANDIIPPPPKGIWAVDMFPFLKHIPAWVPFASFKRKALKWRAQMADGYTRPFIQVKKKLAEGTAIPSFCSILLQEAEYMSAEKEDNIKWAANSIVAAIKIGTVINNLLLLIVLHPAKFMKAKAEIDNVVKGHLPTLADRLSLPYTECVLSEVLRVAAPVPLGLPHRLREDDHYNGYFLPKDSVVIANIMAMLREKSLYPDPEAFLPERFDPTMVDETTRMTRDPRRWIFGFGRSRRCPGMHLAEASTWLAMVSILATLDVTKDVDVDGNVIEPEVKFDNLNYRHVSGFE
ncbi:hypothetical protein CERSUDRAFT_58021 [Gelatoporia subvermispora B]|uniref:Cytochrome P450 n=1 Tax=Ceriporiopsis subvermispora (strain B) TaxID=914234 RepID=M2PAZ6_CERS8|nr:hypothetical protein CERSUDRAFT_58021 [Gelatoporia subvermispora B]